eukprot:14409359-Ditylum_brightwellii.AAC.1
MATNWPPPCTSMPRLLQWIRSAARLFWSALVTIAATAQRLPYPGPIGQNFGGLVGLTGHFLWSN